MKPRRTIAAAAFWAAAGSCNAVGIALPSDDVAALWPATLGRELGARVVQPAPAAFARLATGAPERAAWPGSWHGIAGEAGRQPGTPLGSSTTAETLRRDLRYDAFVVTSRSAQPWRAFLHFVHHADRADAAAASWHRFGGGVHGTLGRLKLAAELSTGSGDRAGAALSMRWRSSQALSFGLQSQSVTNNLPMQAWRAGVWASEKAADAVWEWTSGRKLRAAITRQAFSDGTQREIRSLQWQTAWAARPALRWSAVATLRDVSSSAQGTGWLSAGRDRTLSVELRSDDTARDGWLRRVQRSLLLYAGISSPHEALAHAVHGTSLEQALALGRDLTLRLGLGSEWRPTEGGTQRRSYATLALQIAY